MRYTLKAIYDDSSVVLAQFSTFMPQETMFSIIMEIYAQTNKHVILLDNFTGEIMWEFV